MGRASYTGGSTVVGVGDYGFTPLPEGGDPTKGPAKLTANQKAILKRSNGIKRRRAHKKAKARAKHAHRT